MAQLALAFDILARDRASKTFKDVSKAAEHAGKTGDGFGKKMGGALASTAGLAAKFGGAAALGIAGIGIAGAKMGFDVAAGNEQAKISFTTMLGSAKKADVFLKNLQKFAASTPFEFPELQTAASSLVSAGIEADKVIPIMTTLGDVTSGMGTGSEGVKRATVAIQQMNAAGKITGEDLNQLRDAGIPVYDLLAKATGKSKEAVAGLAAKGKLGKKELGEMMKALESGKGLERFSGLMDKQSQSLTGLVSTFKDTLGQGLANAITPLIPLMKEGLGGASNALAKVLPRIGAALVGIVNLIVKGNFTKEFRQAFHVEEDSKLVDFLLRVRDGFKDAVAGAKDLVAGLTLKNASDIGAPLEGLVAVGYNIRKAMGKAFDYLKEVLPPIWESAKKLWPSIKEIATQLFTASQSGGVSMFKLLGAALKNLPGILDAIAPLLEKVAKWMGENKDLVAALVVAVGTGITAFKIITGIVKTFTIVQGILNAVLAANPIGIVIIAIAGLAAGLIYAYRTSKTFHTIVDLVFSKIKIAALSLAGVAIGAFQRLMNFWFIVVGGLLEGAAKAFGWVPGVGPKLEGAAREFGKFRDSANKKMDGIQKSIQLSIDKEKADHSMDAFYKKWKGKTLQIKAVAYADVGNYRGGGTGGGFGGSVLRPVNAAIGTGFNGYPGHKGIDFPVPTGTPVHAGLSGTVVRAGWDPGGFGNHIRTIDSDGNMTIYGHLSRLVAHVGQKIIRGMLVAFSGHSGNVHPAGVAGSHLHLERRHPPFGISNAWNFAGQLSGVTAKANSRSALLFDQGGILPMGPSIVVNNTGKPEPLARTDRIESFSDDALIRLADLIGERVEAGARRGVGDSAAVARQQSRQMMGARA